ncbi:cholinesterase-like isoform X1 [Homalodisca vitripennis]|uniref:cholinesterase-like isoform X1 n=1 Tax=Homalodisca vitripennis TaxID=197043 RepID=UPI001EE9DD5C|nr:cholinesterase-like isoform X1 [Homalodisca vitripennis]
MSSVQRLALVVFCWASLASVSSKMSQVNVTTSKGDIIGLRVDPNPATGVSYDAFLGVPYGKVQGRFQVAVQPDSWSQPLVTQEDGPMCPQPNAKYSENCLFLNVFTPVNASQNATASLPVMAFIHGSAFTVSSSSSRSYGPDFLIPEGVILVAMNYRLGAAGFLTLGTKIAPGNLGLTDTLLALQWIQKEIHNFGGNRSSVTLMGQSAGSVMTQFHYLSQQSTDLFVRAIAHSGSAASDWGLLTLQEGVRRSMLLAQSVGCDPTMSNIELLKCLQAVDIKYIVANQSIILPEEDIISGSCGMRFVPVLDSYLTADMPFFNNTLENLMAQALARGKPLITGITREDGVVKFMLDDTWRLAEDNLATFIPRRLYQSASDDDKVSLQEQIRDRYFRDTVDNNKVSDLIRIYTDTMFAYPSTQITKYFANITYGYLFQYFGFGWTYAPIKVFPYNMNPVNHGDDLHYLFYMADDPQPLDNCSLNWPNLQMRDNMVAWWTSFAKTGIPSTSWKPVSQYGYLVIDHPTWTKNSSSFYNQYHDFWADLRLSRSSTAKLSTTTISILLSAMLILIFHY